MTTQPENEKTSQKPEIREITLADAQKFMEKISQSDSNKVSIVAVFDPGNPDVVLSMHLAERATS